VVGVGEALGQAGCPVSPRVYRHPDEIGPPHI